MGKRHKPEEIVSKLRQVDVLTGQGSTVADAVRQIGVTEYTYYRWCKEYSGLQTIPVSSGLKIWNRRMPGFAKRSRILLSTS